MASTTASAPSRSAQTRALLWSCAAGEFASNGPDRTRVSDIVRRAGVTQPTFYAYFDTKEDAYASLIASFRSRLKKLNETLLLTAADPAASLVERVADSLRKLLDFLAEDRDLTRIGLFQETAAPGSRTLLARSIAANIAIEQKAGLLRDDIPASRIGMMYVALLEHLAREGGSAKKRAEQALDCARVMCDGLARQ